MSDTLTPAERSEHMSRIRAKNTGPEMRVRRLAHALGYRYRLHQAGLPGKPDLVFRKRRAVIFVHGCFWHQHEGCRLQRQPKSRLEYWLPKLARNIERDEEVRRKLEALGWDILVIWECEVRDREALSAILREFLGDSSAGTPVA